MKYLFSTFIYLVQNNLSFAWAMSCLFLVPLCDQLYITNECQFDFLGQSTLRESWQAELNQILCNEKDVMFTYAKRHVFLFMIAFL